MTGSTVYLAVSFATVLCVGVLLTCLAVFPKMYFEINSLHSDVMSSVQEFKLNTDAAWIELMEIQLQMKPQPLLEVKPLEMESIFKPRRKRANELPEHCNCIIPDTCNVPGPPGPMGPSGEDGDPGYPGANGYDAQILHRECGVVPETCQRCPLGARGLPGLPGKQGLPGSDGPQAGEPGLDGLPGLPGEAGLPGLDGLDAVIVMNFPGEKGSQGLPGLQGLPGINGVDGLPGNDGEIGEIGNPGIRGLGGLPDNDNGHRGLNGIPGADSFYCPCPPRTYYISASTQN